ncbi:NIPSNAP family protein [Phycicoccus sp. CSK15P-2]|uniref:NIPSNAP family protein n=1 Tax=Phycicoccus sp. CSK15P-2 TaxID=2807627 RepID=UPI001950FB54|nr:NIPSNAP family protein [Phycicoccus sp. CSK15P-2]MBM6404788.1 NIPSNAP family protein [Phycicoccus sp. CSK15P-2]
MTTLEPSPPLLELRQYLLREGRLEDLLDVFETSLVEPQEECGMRVVGQFRDVDHPRRFVWLRGFADPAARAEALAAFYGGPVWARHADRANATMVTFDDVLQLRRHPGGPALQIRPAALRDEPVGPGAAVVVLAHRRTGRQGVPDDRVLGALERLSAEAGLTLRSVLETDPAPNGFPRLPVRRANCLVWVATGPSTDVLDPAAESLVGVRADLAAHCAAHDLDEVPLHLRRLVPTARSTLVHEDDVEA